MKHCSCSEQNASWDLTHHREILVGVFFFWDRLRPFEDYKSNPMQKHCTPMWSYELQASSVNSDTSGKYYIPQGFSPPSPLQDSVS